VRRSRHLAGDGLQDLVEQLLDQVGLGGPGDDEQCDGGRAQENQGVLGRRLAPLVGRHSPTSALEEGSQGDVKLDVELDGDGEHEAPLSS
jgi:hypothetical protein